MKTFEIEISTRSGEIVRALSARADAEATTERNITGETLMMLTAAAPAIAAVVREIGKYAHERQLTIRSQKLKIGKGALSFEGFSAADICTIVEAVDKSELT